MTWTRSPVIYEINTWVWLSDISRKYERAVRFGNVPPEEWDGIASPRVDAVWLMGVWERSPEGIKAAMKDEDLQAEFRRTLPDFRPEDVVGSPYCIRRYVVDERLGGPKGAPSRPSALLSEASQGHPSSRLPRRGLEAL